MAESYGFDISKPATNAKEAIQWTYFGYLGSIKQQNGAAMELWVEFQHSWMFIFKEI